MSYIMRTVHKGTYLHIIVTGENTSENVKNYLAEVNEKGKAYSCSNVLLEENLQGPGLSTVNLYNIVTEASNRGGRHFDVLLMLIPTQSTVWKQCSLLRQSQ